MPAHMQLSFGKERTDHTAVQVKKYGYPKLTQYLKGLGRTGGGWGGGSQPWSLLYHRIEM